MENLAEILAALAFFGAVFVLPVVVFLLRHQRAMAELIHKGPDDATLQRIAILEHQVQDLQAARYAQLAQQPSQQQAPPVLE